MASLADVGRRFGRDRTAMFGLGLVALLVAFAALGPALVPSPPNASDFSLDPSLRGGPPLPSLEHPLGTDPLYRDVLSRLAAGARTSLAIASAATLLAVVIGTLLGILAGTTAGTRAKHVDLAVRAVLDVALAFPYLLLVTAIGVTLDRTDAVTVALVLGLTSWVGVARLVREKTLAVRRADFVTAARALGVPAHRIVLRHVLPAIAGTLLVVASHAMGQMILAEAVLGYLTLGVPPPEPTWGRMLLEVEHYLGVEPHLVAAPALAILIAALGFTRVGDGLARALAPRLSGTERLAEMPTRVPFDAVLLAGIAALVALARPDALAPPAQAAARPEDSGGSVLRLATQAPLVTLEPALAYDEASRSVGELLFARLVRFDAGGTLAGDLAETFRMEGDGRSVTLTLREGLTFHDGTPLTAAEVKRSIERALHPKTPCPGASLFANVVGLDAFRAGSSASIEGVEATSERELRVRLREPESAFLSLLSLGFMAPVCRTMGAYADPKSPAPACGAGRFRLGVATPARIELERFARAHDPARLAGVALELDVPPRSQLHRFLAGELDVLSELSGVDTARFVRDDRWRAHQGWLSRPASHGIFLNAGMPPFDNRHLRRAVAFAVDPSVVPKIRAIASPIDRLLPAGVPGPRRTEPLRRHDLEAALAEMKLAGYAYEPSTGKGGYPDVVDYFTTPASFDQAVAETYVEQLARIGIKVRLRLMSHASFLAAVGTPKTAPMGWRGWGADYPDPSNFFEPTLTTRAIASEGSQNVSFFSSAELDRVLTEARTSLDAGARLAQFARAEEIVAEEAPWIPTYTMRTLVVWNPRVRDLALDPFATLRLDRAWLDRPGLGDADRAEPPLRGTGTAPNEAPK